MKILQRIKKRLETKTAGTPSERTNRYWAYKLTIDQVSLIFEIKDLSCFDNPKTEFDEFLNEYNGMFNGGFDKKKFNTDSFRFKMQLKQLKLRAIYEAITSSEAPNSKEEFKLMFGREFKSMDDLKTVIDRYNLLNDKLSIEDNTESNKEGLTFEETVQVTEISRGLPIDRSIKLYSFHMMYMTELKKQG